MFRATTSCQIDMIVAIIDLYACGDLLMSVSFRSVQTRIVQTRL